ncbi:MAG: hypothetical protein HC896_18230 [Bacteroidales bacterium]|nr:hypothetical protein [Bacteroidales bacterium]
MLTISSCGTSSKATSERRGLMMPTASDLPRNSKFKEIDYKSRQKQFKKQKAHKNAYRWN